MLFLYGNLVSSWHRWKCGYCSLYEKCSICFYLNRKPQTWFLVQLQNPFWRQNYSSLLVQHSSLKYLYYQQNEGMHACPSLNFPLRYLQYLQGNVTASLTLPLLVSLCMFCLLALWVYRVRAATIHAGWADPAGAALCLASDVTDNSVTWTIPTSCSWVHETSPEL